jgi:hypothetical protein
MKHMTIDLNDTERLTRKAMETGLVESIRPMAQT